MEGNLWLRVFFGALGGTLAVVLFGEHGVLFPLIPALIEMVHNMFN